MRAAGMHGGISPKMWFSSTTLCLAFSASAESFLSVALRWWRGVSSEQTLRRRPRCLRTANPNRRWSWSAEWVSGSHLGGCVCRSVHEGDVVFLLRWRRRRPQERAGSIWKPLRCLGNLKETCRSWRWGAPWIPRGSTRRTTEMGFLNIFRSARTRVTCSPKSQNIFKPAFPAAYFLNLSGSGGHCCGQPSGLLSFPNPPEEQEEDHGGGAAGRRRVQTVSFEPSPINPSDPDFQDVCVAPDGHPAAF